MSCTFYFIAHFLLFLLLLFFFFFYYLVFYFIFFIPIFMYIILCLYYMHCPWSGPDISLLVIFCIIVYVTNTNLESWIRAQFETLLRSLVKLFKRSSVSPEGKSGHLNCSPLNIAVIIRDIKLLCNCSFLLSRPCGSCRSGVVNVCCADSQLAGLLFWAALQ